jgi:RNA polymerase sigma-70 factor (ECF subfamily)
MADIRSRLVEEIPRLRRSSRTFTRDVTTADDLVRDCLTRAVSKSHLWQDATDLRAWLFIILRNQYVNQVRRAGCRGKSAALCDAERMTMVPDHEKRLEVQDLERALATLPEEQRWRGCWLVGMEGMRYEEAAAVPGVPVGTIRSRLPRGREALRQLMSMETERRGFSLASPRRRPRVNLARPSLPAGSPRLPRGQGARQAPAQAVRGSEMIAPINDLLAAASSTLADA